eukprot:NODE_2764_length_1045_cov_4.893574_g2309_i0.p2 GENE.NODE_2764_length_1045_cov_4.893574_g2309_i0~~NODE_2764_length_1045_cov_4.893574_g2309_i0.p2  ORF type:complete len:210 (+),score=2.29 NODE_2764_length_1045_cov_4.893574_g2309_i0:119-748(+)
MDANFAGFIAIATCAGITSTDAGAFTVTVVPKWCSLLEIYHSSLPLNCFQECGDDYPTTSDLLEIGLVLPMEQSPTYASKRDLHWHFICITCAAADLSLPRFQLASLHPSINHPHSKAVIIVSGCELTHLQRTHYVRRIQDALRSRLSDTCVGNDQASHATVCWEAHQLGEPMEGSQQLQAAFPDVARLIFSEGHEGFFFGFNSPTFGG